MFKLVQLNEILENEFLDKVSFSKPTKSKNGKNFIHLNYGEDTNRDIYVQFPISNVPFGIRKKGNGNKYTLDSCLSDEHIDYVRGFDKYIIRHVKEILKESKNFKLSSSVKKVDGKPVFRQRVSTKPPPVVFGVDKENIDFSEEIFSDPDGRMEFIVKICGIWYLEEDKVMGVDYLCQQMKIRKPKKGKRVVEEYLFSEAEDSSESDDSYGSGSDENKSDEEKLFSSDSE